MTESLYRLNSKINVREVAVNDLVTDLSDGVGAQPSTLKETTVNNEHRSSLYTFLRSSAMSPWVAMPRSQSCGSSGLRMSTKRSISLNRGAYR